MVSNRTPSGRFRDPRRGQELRGRSALQAAVVEAVRGNPGVTTRKLCSLVRRRWGDVLETLHYLQEAGVLESCRVRGRGAPLAWRLKEVREPRPTEPQCVGGRPRRPAVP